MSLRHVILAILSHAPATGYDITREFEDAAGFFWRASHQQIYRELGAMSEEGLVSYEAVPQEGKPNKKLYSVTPEGQCEFARWFAEPTSAPRASDPLLIKFFAGGIGGAVALREQLRQARGEHETYLRVLESVQREHYAEPVQDMPTWKACIFLALQLGLARERAWLDWSADADRVLAAIGRAP